MAQIVRMTEHLDRLEPVEKTRMAECLTELIGRMKRREIVMIFSDFFTDLDALEAVLQRMRYHRHEVVLFQVMHHDELAFEFDGMTKFVGLEIPEEMLAQPEDMRRGYLQAVRAIQRPLRGNLPQQPRRARAGRHQPRHGRSVRRLSEPAQPAEPRAVRPMLMWRMAAGGIYLSLGSASPRNKPMATADFELLTETPCNIRTDRRRAVAPRKTGRPSRA